jgi:hypothetical protein
MANVSPFGTVLVPSAVRGRPVLYAWDVHVPTETHARQGACGVSHQWACAVNELRNALMAMPPGIYGTVRKVTTSLSGDVRYLDLGVVGDGTRGRKGVSWVAYDPAFSPAPR